MKVDPIKTSFAGGEFGSSLYGRTDIPSYLSACATVENMLCRPFGSVVSTPGTRYVREVRYSNKKTCLIPFVFSRVDSSIIEMGDKYMRFYNSSQDVTSALVLDMMEYATDVDAHSAFVSNATGSEAEDQSLTSGTLENSLGYPGRKYSYQIFTAGATGKLTKFSVALKIGSGTAAQLPGVYTGYLYATDGTSPTTLIATFSDLDPKLCEGNYKFFDFTIALASAPSVTAATQYALVVKASIEDYSHYTHTAINGTYAGGSHGSGDSSLNWANESDDWNFKTYVTDADKLMAFSEASLKTQGEYSLKAVANVTTSLNKTLTKTFGVPIDLSNASQYSFDIRSTRTGSSLKIGIHDSGGTTTEVTPNILAANTWQSVTVDLSSVAIANRDSIDSIIVTVVNADADNTFYLDNMFGLFSEVATPYSEDEIFDVQYSQLNDIIYMTHKNHPPKKLTRLSASSWLFENFAFVGGAFLNDNTTAITITPSAATGQITITLSATNSTIGFIPSTSTIGHIGSYWKIGLGLTTSSTTGLSVQGYVKIIAITSSTIAVATVMATLDGTSATTVWAEGAWSAVRGYPARNTFHESRFFLARTNTEPQKVWGSRPFEYENFAVGAEDDDALNLQLASNEANEIMWLASTTTLIVGTYGGEFIISSGSLGQPITPTNATSFRQTGWGSEPIVPKKIGNFLYYIQRFGQKLRELFYYFDLDSYKSLDKTIFAPHIAGTGDGFVDMAYQQNPETILWCVRGDGQIATFTREIDQEVQAWSRQVTDGLFESIATIPNSTRSYDEVWVVVNRTINGVTKRYIEVFGDMNFETRVDLLCYVHCGATYNGYDLTTGSTLTLSATKGTVTLTLSATSSTISFDATDVGQRIRAIDSDGNVLGEAVITLFSSSTIAVASVSTIFTATTYAGMSWGKSAQVISGLTHLEGKVVSCLVDGGLDNARHTVTGGSITLGRDYFVAVVGLPYDQTVKTLPFEAGSVLGTAQGKIQRINQIGFLVRKTFTGFYFGGDDDKLERAVYRNPANPLGVTETLHTGYLPNKTFKGYHQYGSQILIVNEDPMPMEILSIMPSLTTSDKWTKQKA